MLCFWPHLSNALWSLHAQVKEQGWLPQHVLVRNEATGQLLGACPLYLKSHSYGMQFLLMSARVLELELRAFGASYQGFACLKRRSAMYTMTTLSLVV